MWSLTGISDERAAVSHRGSTRAAAVALTAALAALLTGIGFRTIDSGGTERIRSAWFVWRIASAAIVNRVPLPHAAAIYGAALAVLVAGCFALLWLAAAIEPERGDEASDAAAGWQELSATLSRSAPFGPAAVRLSIAALAALALYTAWRMQLFAPIRAWGVPDTFASFDHPFHVARAETLVRSLLHGRLLTWVANHQGGYPVEFYPFGFAWFEAALWALAAGRLPMPVVHRVAVVLLFVAPSVLFYAMTRRDGWPPIVALAAFALHVAMPGDMWGGGYGELVYVGLVANVGAALAAVVAMVAAADAFATGRGRSAAVCAGAAATAIWCNPRSALALVVCVGAAWLVTVWRSPFRRPTTMLAGVAAVGALLAAPELLSLVRFGRLYYFVRYTGYNSSFDYLAASIDIVSMPAFALAGIGTIAGFVVDRRRAVTRTVAVSLIAYAAMTLTFSFGASSAIEQLETTRLMPVQRLLTIYAAAVGLHVIAVAAFSGRRRGPSAAAVAQALVVAVLLFVCLGPERFLPFWWRGLFPVQRTGEPMVRNFQQIVKGADHEAPPGTAILVVGSGQGLHLQLWAPVVADRLFFYDDWMWYWHTRHRGPYDPRSSSKFDPERIDEIFERDYLERNAIGAVVATESAQHVADESPALRRVLGGPHALYAVTNPVPVVTFGRRAPDALRIENELITADGTSGGSDAVIRRNWFPRWHASVNGRPAPIVPTDDGYMRVPTAAGPVHLVLTYDLDRLDVAARVAALIGVVALVALVRRKRAASPRQR